MGREEWPFADRALARRLERAEATANTHFVEARAALQPASGATWIEVAGTYAMFDTPESPVTQSFGLGLFDSIGAAELDRLEAFFTERGAPVSHEISPLGDPALLPLLTGRGYQPVEFTSVMYRPIAELAGASSEAGPVSVRPVRDDEAQLCARIMADGWKSEHPELEDFLLDIGQLNARREGTLTFFAELHGRPVATGVLVLHEGVALFGGACTVPEARRQGAHRALFDARLRHAAAQGCDVAMISAGPVGGASQRNAERDAFRTAYTRIKWRLARNG
jgi:GNAT superfamily N-acetyltransferase